MVLLVICALLLIVSSYLGPTDAFLVYREEGCTLPGNINGRYVGMQPGDVLEEGRSIEVQCDPGTTDRVKGRLRCWSQMLDRALPFCPRDCKLEAGDRLLVGTNFHRSAPLVLHHQYSVTLQCQEGYRSTVPLLSVFCEDGRLTQPRNLAFCIKGTGGTPPDEGKTSVNSDTRSPGRPPLEISIERITDCSKADTSNVYTIVKGGLNLKAYCQVDETGKWTVIQRRQDGSVNFTRNWANYSKGFGDVAGEHWLGNDNIHALTAAGLTELRIDLEDWDINGHTVYYKTFRLAAAEDKYKLTVAGYSGSDPPGDSLTYHNGMKFGTYDSDNDEWVGNNCASVYGGTGWWYRGCHQCNLNGRYNRNGGGEGIVWRSWHGWYYSLRKTTMMVRQP